MSRSLLAVLLAGSALSVAGPAAPVLAQEAAAGGSGAAGFSESAGANDQQAVQVEDIVVTGRAQRRYRVTETTAARGAADPLEIPQSLTVITAELAEDQGARDVTDLYRNIAGVTTFSYSGVTFRGFRQDQVFYDSLRGNPFIGFSVPQLFNIGRVEVLKGPAGMLYGPGSPGGLINYVTKTPKEVFRAEARLIVGDNERRGGSAEVTGPLTADGRLSGRLGGFYEYRGPVRVNTDSEIGIFDAGLAYRLTDGAKLTLQATHYDQKADGNRLRGVPVTNDGDFLAPLTWNHNEPTDYLDLTADVVQGRLEWRLSDATRLDLGARWTRANEIQNYHEPRALRDTNADGVVDFVDREFRDQKRDGESRALGGTLSHETALLGVEHRLLVGGDWAVEESLSFSRIAPTRGTTANTSRPGGVSLVNPVYGLTNPSAYVFNASTFGDTESTRWGVFVQDQVKLTEQFSLVGGVRYDSFEDRDRLTGRSFDEAATTFRAGVIYQPVDGLSLYASWSEGFETQSIGSQDPRAGGPFDPVEGEQVEAGIKGALMGGRAQFAAAVFEIKRRNILQSAGVDAAGDGVDDQAQLGEVTSTGFEVEGAFDITPNWVVTANYAYNDARITATRTGQTITNAVGDRFANSPEHEAGLWTRYDFDSIGFSAAIGAEYVGERVSLGGQRVRPYTILDASLIQRIGERYEVLLRVNNLTDQEYAASGFDVRNGHFPGTPRSAFVELRARW